ncbi:Pol polyprotein [Plakobranchus ocellatus]|uniref:Pol polyprotein n=1 Tax=Plakobranchus ocellatus TaxID=259542 RepID=A0AAV4C5H8_9GAST|nr:Pol polyprotein [Plakobranchus ocellatus]
MSELDLYARYLDMGARLGMSGDDLAAWVEDKVRQDMERNDRLIEGKGKGKKGKKVDLYLERFERHAAAFGWHESEWASCLVNLLQDEALSVFLSLSPTESAGHQSVKRVLLRRFNCDRNGFSSKFLSVKPQADEDVGIFINRAKRYFDRCVELSGVSTREGLCFLICSEIALQACDEDFVAYVKDRSPSDMVSLKAVASAYIDTKPNKSFAKKSSVSFSTKAESEPCRPSVRAYGRSNWPRSQRGVGRGNYPSQGHRSPCSQGYSGSGRSGTSHSPSRNRNRSSFNTRSVGRGQQFRPNLSGGFGVAASRYGVTCYQSNGKGHVRRECPSRPKEANSACSVPKLPSHFCAAESGCDRRGKLKIESCKVFDRVSILLRDLGCNTVGVCKSLIPPDCYTGRHRNLRLTVSRLLLTLLQREDPSLAPWFKRVGLSPVAGVSFQIEDGVLKRLHAKSEFATVQTTIAVPESLRQLVLSYAHESDLASHLGFRKTLSAIRTQFSWPGVCSDVKNYTTSCHLCQIKPRTSRDRPAPFQPVPIIGEPFERVMIDLVGPLSLSSDRYEYLLTLVGVSTRWAEAVPLRRITAKDVAEALFSIFVRLGFPKEIQSDRGQQFMSKLLAEFNSLCNITHFVSTPYHPQTNGIVERFHFTLKSMIKKLLHESPAEWNRFVPAASFANRNQVHSPTGFSPFFLLFGRAPRDNKLVLSFKGPYKVIEKRTSVVYLVDLSDQKCTFHVSLLRKYKRSTYASPSPSGNLDKVDNACSNQAVADAVSLCDPSVFPFGSVSSVEASLSVDTIVDKELHPHRDSDLPFCETICFAEATAYVSAISKEDGSEIGSLVTTPPLASESGKLSLIRV